MFEPAVAGIPGTVPGSRPWRAIRLWTVLKAGMRCPLVFEPALNLAGAPAFMTVMRHAQQAVMSSDERFGE
jgi:hypothetical protein